MRKILLVVLDGMADLPVKALGGLTPLEAAPTPNLDALARRGAQGTMSTIAPGVAPESDAAVMSLLGYDVKEHYTGRGPLEACGAGMEVRDGDLAWRANFGTVDPGWNILDRRAGRDLGDDEAAELAAAVAKDVHLAGASLNFQHTTGHRACLLLRSVSGELSGEVCNGDPGYRREGPYSVAVASPDAQAQPITPLRQGRGAALAAELTNDFLKKSFAVLDGHPVNARRRERGALPANFILLRDAGSRLPVLPHFIDRFGLRFGAVVEMPVERGLAQLTGMAEIPVGRPSGDVDRDLGTWARLTADGVADLDGVYVHIKGPDLPGHDGDPGAKAQVLATIDRVFLGQLSERVDLGTMTVCVTADHATPCELMAHSADPVPVVVVGGVPPDGAGSFGEVNAFGGKLGTFLGPELMPRLVEIATG